jgi:Fe2+ transport system protein FeoA
MADGLLIPLSEVEIGKDVKLVTIDAGRELASRLVAMGMVPNSVITVVGVGRPGPFTINVKGSKVALGKGMAQRIMVRYI